MARIGTTSQRMASGSMNDPNYGRTLGSGPRPVAMPAYQPQPQSFSQQTTQYQQAPAPVLDPYGEARYQGMSAAAAKADPYAQYRTGWLDKLKSMSSGGAGFSSDDPSYAWRLKQGQGAVESSLASRGLLGSGRAGTELTDYAQGQASTEFQAQHARLSELAGLGDPGQAAALEQAAVESRYRTFQPSLQEIGSSSIDYGFPGYGDSGSGGGGYGGGSSSGGSRSPKPYKSQLAEFLRKTPKPVHGDRESVRRYEQGQTAASVADHMATGYDPMENWYKGWAGSQGQGAGVQVAPQRGDPKRGASWAGGTAAIAKSAGDPIGTAYTAMLERNKFGKATGMRGY